MTAAFPPAREHGLYHPDAGHSGDVGKHQQEFDVHLLQGLLHPQDHREGLLRKGFPVSCQCPHAFGVVGRLEARFQQAVLMEQHQPLCIGFVRLAVRDVLDIPRVGKHHIEAVFLQDAKQWNPILLIERDLKMGLKSKEIDHLLICQQKQTTNKPVI